MSGTIGELQELKQLMVLDEKSQNPEHELYVKLQKMKQLVGMGIFSIGAILCVIKKYSTWVNYASSWREFCVSEVGSYGHAQRCIRLHEKFVDELQLPESTISKLALRDYTSLSAVSQVITKDNVEEWLPKLLALGRQDIIAELRLAQGKEEINRSDVDKVVLLYFSLATHTERSEVKRIIAEREENRQGNASLDPQKSSEGDKMFYQW